MKLTPLLVLPLLLAAALISCSTSSNESPDTFDVSGNITGQADNPDRFGADSCTFYDGTVSKGTPVVVRGSGGDILGKGSLSGNVITGGPACGFTFKVTGVKAKEAGYTVSVEPYEPVVVTETELRTPDFHLSTRNAFDVLSQKGKQPISVSNS